MSRCSRQARSTRITFLGIHIAHVCSSLQDFLRFNSITSFMVSSCNLVPRMSIAIRRLRAFAKVPLPTRSGCKLALASKEWQAGGASCEVMQTVARQVEDFQRAGKWTRQRHINTIAPIHRRQRVEHWKLTSPSRDVHRPTMEGSSPALTHSTGNPTPATVDCETIGHAKTNVVTCRT